MRKQPDERRAEIAGTAAQIALTEGLPAITLRAVAQRLGVAPALVAHYEPSMDELRARTVETLLAEELARFREAAERERSALKALRSLLGLLVQPGREQSAALWLDAWSHGMGEPLLEQTVRRQMESWQDFVSGVLSRGMRSGEFAGTDPDQPAWQLIALADGLNAHSLVHYRSPRDRRALLAAALEKSLGLASGTLNGDPGELDDPDYEE